MRGGLACPLEGDQAAHSRILCSRLNHCPPPAGIRLPPPFPRSQVLEQTSAGFSLYWAVETQEWGQGDFPKVT